MKVIELKLQEENKGEGITAISLVKNPAIELGWVAFSADGKEYRPEKQYEFKTIDEDQRIVAGPAMVPDKLIYRLNPEGEESFVFFKADTIRELSERFLYQGKQNNMTLEHEATLNDLSVIESWIVEDPKRDKSQVYGFSLPVGSWFVKVKVLNDDVWNLVKEGGVTGFSVEGVFASELIKNQKKMKQSKLDEYLDRIKSLFADQSPKPEEAEAETEEQKFGSVEATDSTGVTWVISFPGDELEEGTEVTIQVEGETVPLPTGEYEIAGGGKIVVTEDGIVGRVELPDDQSTVEKEDEMKENESAQMEALIDALAKMLTQFKSDVTEELSASVTEAEGRLREEFNKPAAKPKPETPETQEQRKVVASGLNRFVQEAKANKGK